MKDILKGLVKAIEGEKGYAVGSIGLALDGARDILDLFDRRIPLLDHGHLGLVDFMGMDVSIARNARVSYDAEWKAGEDAGSDSRLINYLHSNGHNTPFEAITLTFDVKAPIFVFRQWHRHRTWSYNELSARYKELLEEFYVPEPHLIGAQAEGNKQCRDVMSKEEFNALPAEKTAGVAYLCQRMRSLNVSAFKEYKHLLSRGVPRELARSVLPVATYSHMFATVNLHNLFNFLRERLHPHAQYEIRVYAEAMLELVESIVPVAVAAFKAKTDLT